MDKNERLKWLKQIEKDIYVCSLDSTFADDAKSCAIHSVIEELENQKTGHWTENRIGIVVCSNCNGIRRDNRSDYIKFCNKCGAKME